MSHNPEHAPDRFTWSSCIKAFSNLQPDRITRSTMAKVLPLSDKKKLRVIFRVEPGCLGPDGENLIDDFCQFAQPRIDLQNASKPVDWADLITCELAPRSDKSLPEVQYTINTKALSHEKAERYFALFSKQLDEFEHDLNEKLSDLIDTYLSS